MVDYDAINSSDIPPEVPRSEDSAKDPENVLRGHKATLNNPQQSDAAKEHSKQVLENADEPYDQSSSDTKTTDQGEKDPGNVARGLKAAISNPGVSEEAKESAKEKLKSLGE
ncbi:putative conidiation-specific expression protein [Sordaria sp. MPI-SDFR-AT-0083]|nr:putative conidiation-specific expression protein [Sordaria sp. MPI-SDFR-AT-0083]